MIACSSNGFQIWHARRSVSLLAPLDVLEDVHAMRGVAGCGITRWTGRGCGYGRSDGPGINCAAPTAVPFDSCDVCL